MDKFNFFFFWEHSGSAEQWTFVFAQLLVDMIILCLNNPVENSKIPHQRGKNK